jgi:TRAP-type C4-dicarboxylate transport system permease small subunit
VSGALGTLDRLVGRLLRGVAITCLATLLALLASNVVGRLTAWYTFAWYDEIIEMLFAWMVFVGAAALWREHEHFRIDWLALQLPRRLAPWHGLLVVAIDLAFLWFMAREGLRLTARSTAVTPVLALPVGLLYASIPLSAAMMALYSLHDAVQVLRGHRPGGTAPVDD